MPARFPGHVAIFSSFLTVCLAADTSRTDSEQPSASQAAASENSADGLNEELLAGHSIHGEAFNEGPRQKAYLMAGTGNVNFPVTTTHQEAQTFVTQGVGQLHGFWYFEAERSFRQAAALDPECAMAYWGMAMANIKNEERGQGFIAEAIARKDNITDRERRYIEALDAYLQADTSDAEKKTQRNKNYIKALEELVFEYPDDIEAKAFVCLQIWLNTREKLPVSSYLAADALLQQILSEQPDHPCHHYRIHLWDKRKAERALESAARCGQAAPAIAHMWHMPGHIYSKLKRYEDATWQQEASARVDHAHMMRDQVLPDQIHNFAHNNEWLIRNLIHLGRMHDALDLAINMIELPRHPKYNHFEKRGSATYGRMRLLDVLSKFELWDDLLRLSETPYLERTDVAKEQVRRFRYVGKASFRSGRDQRGHDQIALLERILKQQETRRNKAGDEAAAKAKSDGKTEEEIKAAAEEARKPFSDAIKAVEKALSELRGYVALSDGHVDEALTLFKKAGGVESEYLTHVELSEGKAEAALKRARDHAKKHENEVIPLASLVETLWAADQSDEAKQEFEKLRRVARDADLNAPILNRLEPVAAACGYSKDWRNRDVEAVAEVTTRPDLDTLGPFRWQPSSAPSWTLTDTQGQQRSLSEFSGRPVVVIFYLGFGCLHCAEQLQAFAPKTQDFEQAGLSLIAISTDDQKALSRSHEVYDDGRFPFPLVSDSKLDVFRRYRAFDDFEDVPLHGTFLIDGNGLVRWHDIGHEPFSDPDFVLREAKRLLAKPMHLLPGS